MADVSTQRPARRAALYNRISHDPSLGRDGVERQGEDGLALAKSRGFQVVEVLEDNDVSAAGKVARPGFERLLELIESRSIDTVIAWNFDRLTRNRRDTLRLIEAGQTAGLLLVLVRGSDIDMSTPAGRLTADILASVARNEIEVKSDRQKRANEQRAARGQGRGSGRRAFGYNLDMSIREPEAQAVRDAYEWLLSGISLGEVVRRWNAADLHTPHNGQPWSPATASRCITKCVYAGILQFRGEEYGTGDWEPLVSLDQWTQLRVLFSDPKRRRPKFGQRLLSGVARCGVCGTHTVNARAGRTGLGVYGCSGPVNHLSRRRDHIEQHVTDLTIAVLSRPDAREVFAPRETGTSSATVTRMREIDDKLDGLAALYASNVLTAKGVQLAADELRAERAQLDAQLSAYSPGLAQVRQVAEAPDAAAAWAELSIDAQRSIVDELMTITLNRPVRGARTFDPDTVVIEPKV